MESILHIEPLTAEIKDEESVGETECVFYGSGELEEDDDVGRLASYIRLGAPLETIPVGLVSIPVRLAKSFELYPDLTGRYRNVFTETIHFINKGQFVPIRTSVRVGPGETLKYTHIPSLDFARSSIAGSFPSALPYYVRDPLSEMIDGIVKNDRSLKRKCRHPFVEWVNDDLHHLLSKQTTAISKFNGSHLVDKVTRFKNHVMDAPCTDMSSRYISDVIKNLLDGREYIPLWYQTDNPIRRTFDDFRIKTINHSGDFRSLGDISFIDKSSIITNPKKFLKTLNYLDSLPFTDLNIDIVFADGEISKVYTHIALDRISNFAFDWDQKESCVADMTHHLYVEDILEILREFVDYLQGRNEVIDRLILEPLKIKIVKTIKDQVAFLIYHYNSGPEDSPLCGVYFNIPLLSLAPITLIPGYS